MEVDASSQDRLLRTQEGRPVGVLRLRHVFDPPKWSHPRAEYFVGAYDFIGLADQLRTRGRFFTGRFAASSDGRFVLLEELELDGSQESIDHHSSRLVIIDLQDANESVVGRIDEGHCFPTMVSADKVAYSKAHRTEPRVLHDYERSLDSLDWTKVGEVDAALDD